MAIDRTIANDAGSLLHYQQFQNAYVTNDLERAMATFRENYGIVDFQIIRDFPASENFVADIAMVWVGNFMIELIEGRGDPQSIYQRYVPGPDYALKFHHTGYVIHDQSSWDEVRDKIRKSNRKIVLSGSIPDFVSWIYVEAPELGHYLEYAYPKGSAAEIFNKTTSI